MAIPEDQLTTWAQIGAQKTSKDTYATIKSCLDAGSYGDRTFCSFLQGSYGNDTNIRTESDVDVVMELTGVYYYDLSSLPPDQVAQFTASHGAANYNFTGFRDDVLKVLNAKFRDDVAPGGKAITVKANGNRRKADVLACVKHHKLTYFSPDGGENKAVGICFFNNDGTKIVNYPRLHCEHLTVKNQQTNEWFKHLVRIFKNARQKLITDGAIGPGVAPSYYIEGLLYNVPANAFGTSYAASMLQCLTFLTQNDRAGFVCANEQYRLLDGGAEVTWNAADCNAYINSLVNLWNQW
jgi:hypothetical protein